MVSSLIIMKKFLTSLFFAFVTFNSFAATYWVDKNAVGSNNGTSQANAWTSPKSINVAAGDTVNIVPNTYSFNYWVPNNSGTAASLITYQVDPNTAGTLTFDGTNSPDQFISASGGNRVHNWRLLGDNRTIVKNWQQDLILADTSTNWTVDGVSFLGMGIRCNSSRFVTITNCYFNTTNADHAIALGGSSNCVVSDTTIYISLDNAGDGEGDDGIQQPGDNSLIQRVVIIGHPITNYTAGQHQDGIQFWASGVTIRDYYGFNLGNATIFNAPIGVATSISNNSFFNVISMYCSQSIAIGNNNQGEIATNSNLLIANCTVADGGAFFRFPTLIGATGTNIYVNARIINNALHNSTEGDYAPGITHSNNVTGSGTNSFIAYVPAADLNIITNDYNFQLKSTDTNYLNAGADLSVYFTTDYAGTTRSGTWEAGAYEYQAAQTAQTRGLLFKVRR